MPATPPLRTFARRASALCLPALALGLALLSGHPAAAAELKVLTTGAFKPVVADTAKRFSQSTGTQVTVDNDTAGALVKRVEGGEGFDVLILTPAALAALQKSERVGLGTVVPLAKVGIGVAVKAGAPKPDVSTPDAFKAALLAARKVAMIDPASGGSSGIYLTGLFEKMGIADEVKAKAVLVPGGLVATRVVSGEADLAIHQVSEILAVPGAELVAPLPAAIQNYTVYAGALAPNPSNADTAASFLALLAAPDMAPTLAAKGMEKP